MQKIIEKLRSLNKSVPKPLRLPSRDEIRSIEIELGLSFHPDYILYLLEASDVVYGTLEPATIPIDSGHTYIGNIIRTAQQIGLPISLVPIAEDNGSFYCMNEVGEVLFWSHDGVTKEKWPNLANWIQEVWINDN